MLYCFVVNVAFTEYCGLTLRCLQRSVQTDTQVRADQRCDSRCDTKNPFNPAVISVFHLFPCWPLESLSFGSAGGRLHQIQIIEWFMTAER